MTIHEYFVKQLGQDSNDPSLVELPVDSNCGDDCKRIIDAYAILLAQVDPHPNCVNPLIESARVCVRIYWHG